MSEIIPLSFDDWVYQYCIEEKYQQFHDEYGDAACFLSDYKQRHYQEYLEEVKAYNERRKGY